MSSHQRAWFQFSLRSLMAAITVLAAMLGIVLIVVAPLERQRLAVRRIEQLGGRVHYDAAPKNESPVVRQFRNWLPRDYFDTVSMADLGGTSAGDAELVQLGSFVELRFLYLGQTRVSDDGLAHLEGMTKLVELSLGDSRITDAGLTHLQRLTSLTTLDLHGTGVTDKGLTELRELTNLREIDLRTTAVSDSGLVSLQELDNLTALYLQGSRVSAAGEAEFQKARRECFVLR